MRKLILVKHSSPEKEPNLPAKMWHLSDEGKTRCKPLAEKLALYNPVAIVSSEEPKAIETAQLVAQYLGNLPRETAPDLHEHDRTNVGYLGDEEFQQTVARFFAQPDKLVMGLETARQAHDRFAKAVESVLEKYPQGNLVIVAHGTVISLFVAALKQIDPYPLWQQLDLPDVVELTLNEDSASMIAYVGSYTTPELNGQGDGISVFRVDLVSGRWTQVQVVKEAIDPSFLVLDEQERYLYCVCESQEQTSVFSIDSESGKLTFLNTQSTGGSTPASLSLDPTNRFLIVGNYFGGTVALLPVNQDGTLAPICKLIQTQDESGSNPQSYSHPHDIRFDPAGRYLFVPLKGYDKILSYNLMAAEGKLVANDPASVTVDAGTGPRHIVFHPNGPFAYVVNELDSTVIVFHYESEQGTLQELQTISTLPSDFIGENTGAEINVAPSGKFLYASNRGHDSIVVFEIEQSSGKLSPVQWVSTQGKNPRFFTLDPWGKYLYAANQNSNTIVAFEVDPTSGKLTPTGQVIETGSPVCIAFAHQGRKV